MRSLLVLALVSAAFGAHAESTRPPVARLDPLQKQRGIAPPKTPSGLPQCSVTLAPSLAMPRLAGETIRYNVDIGGISVGTVDFKIEKNGTHEGEAVTEYRSLFKLDTLVSTFVPVEGRAAALVPREAYTPKVAMNHYELDKNTFEEDISLESDGKRLASRRKKNGELKKEERIFPSPVQDFVSGFYMLRSLPADANGCAIIYGNQRAYTIWIKPDGTERIKTPIGMQLTDRYVITYGSEKSKKPFTAHLWMSQGSGMRLPYQAQIDGDQTLIARVHLYEAGR
jgi:hypothetical protein